MRRRAVATLAVLAGVAGSPATAWARPSATLDAGTVFFFSDTLALVGRGGASLRLDDGTRASADAIAVDLKTDRAVLAGHARIARGTASASADAIALQLDGDRVDLLDVSAGDRRTTRALGPATDAPTEPARFAFPDVVDRFAYIRARHAAITPHANVRFLPAAFPTSVGAVPVPSYLRLRRIGPAAGGLRPAVRPVGDLDRAHHHPRALDRRGGSGRRLARTARLG
jgi:hypothetical protein